MTARDRLAADLHDTEMQCQPDPVQAADMIYHRAAADRLIALGWTRLDAIPTDMTDYMAGYRQGKSDAMEDWDKMRRPLDEERLARALVAMGIAFPDVAPGYLAAAIATTYREDTDATD